MYSVMYYVHIISAIVLAVYIFIPVGIGQARNAGAQVSAAHIKQIVTMNRLGQFVLVLALLSGGYMVSKVQLSVLWMIVSVVLLFVIGAMGGMMGKPLKRWAEQPGSSPDASKLMAFSLIAAISYVILLIIMFNPGLL